MDEFEEVPHRDIDINELSMFNDRMHHLSIDIYAYRISLHLFLRRTRYLHLWRVY